MGPQVDMTGRMQPKSPAGPHFSRLLQYTKATVVPTQVGKELGLRSEFQLANLRFSVGADGDEIGKTRSSRRLLESGAAPAAVIGFLCQNQNSC